jgi:hypothetical protein
MVKFNAKSGISYYKEKLAGALIEAKDLIHSYPKRFSEKTTKGKFFSIGKLTAIPATMILTSGTSLSSAGVLGAVALAAVMINLRLKNNKHKNAMGMPIALSLSTQKIMLGAYGYAVMAGFAAVRGFTMACLPDDKKYEKLRNRVGLAFAFTSMACISMVAYKTGQLWDLIPLGSSLLGTLASTRINDKSFQARICHVIANTQNGIYSALFSGSAGAAIIDFTGASMAATTISENDIPQKKKGSEKPLSLPQKISIYTQALFNPSVREGYNYTKPKPPRP